MESIRSRGEHGLRPLRHGHKGQAAEADDEGDGVDADQGQTYRYLLQR